MDGLEQNREARSPRLWLKRLLFDHINLFTLILIVISLLQLYAFEQTERALKATLEFAKFEQRPWVFHTAPPTISGPLSLQLDGAQIALIFTLKNSGKLPARNAFIWANLYPSRIDEDAFSPISHPANCINPPALSPGGPAVFPGDSVTIPSINVTTPDALRIAVARASNAIIHLAISGCINYRSLTDEEVHQTGISYLLSHIDAKNELTVNFDVGLRTFDAKNLNLQRLAAGEYAK
jgi:hypothetical protein